MTNKTEITAKEAAEQLQDLLKEKRDTEAQIDCITRAEKIVSRDKEQGYKPRLIDVRVCAQYGSGESQFNIDASILAEATQTMLDKHAKRLDEINDSLLFMVKLIK